MAAEDLKRGDRVRTPNGDVGTVESVASRYVVVKEDSGYAWRGLADDCSRLDAVHVPEREEQTMAKVGDRIRCPQCGSTVLVESRNGAPRLGYHTSPKTGLTCDAVDSDATKMDLTEVEIAPDGGVEVCVDPSGDEAAAAQYAVMSATSALCPYCSRSVSMSRGSLGEHRAHGGVCDGAGRRVSSFDAYGRAVLMAAADSRGQQINRGDRVRRHDDGSVGRVVEVGDDRLSVVWESGPGTREIGTPAFATPSYKVTKA